MQFASIQEGLQEVLLGVAEIGGDSGEPLPHRGQILHALEKSAKVSDIVASYLDSVGSAVLGVSAAHVVFQDAVFIQGPQDRLAQVQVLQSGLQPAIVPPVNRLAKDHRHLVGAADSAVGVQ